MTKMDNYSKYQGKRIITQMKKTFLILIMLGIILLIIGQLLNIADLFLIAFGLLLLSTTIPIFIYSLNKTLQKMNNKIKKQRNSIVITNIDKNIFILFGIFISSSVISFLIYDLSDIFFGSNSIIFLYLTIILFTIGVILLFVYANRVFNYKIYN